MPCNLTSLSSSSQTSALKGLDGVLQSFPQGNDMYRNVFQYAVMAINPNCPIKRFEVGPASPQFPSSHRWGFI